MSSPQTIGYDDTPVLQNSKYRVHDGTRPQPRVVTPASADTPPSDAIVLFDGTDLSGWKGKNGPAEWKVEQGVMQVVPKTGDISSVKELGDCQLHVEWAAPAEVKGEGQGRGNSGVFLMERYEIQVLDCYENPTYADGTTGGIYGQYPPLVNACLRPGEWQTYDIVWIAPRFDGDSLLSPARVTVFQNGILLHHDKELLGPTCHRTLTEYKPHPPTAPLKLQDHGDLVQYRNIWYRPLGEYDQG